MKRILILFFLLATLGFTKSHAQFDAGTGGHHRVMHLRLSFVER